MKARDTGRTGWRRLGRPRYAGALTPRQQEVIKLVELGLTNDEIAQRLGITEDGVKYHVSQILLRLGVESRHDAVALHLRTETSGWLAAWAPVMFLRKLPFASPRRVFDWLPQAAAGAVLTATAVGIALLAWGVMSTSTGRTTTTLHGESSTGCTSAEQSAGNPPPCAPGVVQAAAGAGAISEISAGAFHSCALKDGGVWCWGNYYAGDPGFAVGSHVPMPLPGLKSGVSAISSGLASCALQDGGAWCWGALLRLAPDGTVVPVAVPGLASGVSAISSGGNLSCAVKDGGAWCWGDQAAGSIVPSAIPGLEGRVSAISTGANLACALKDGGAWCWGSNWAGQLGNNSTSDSYVPVAVSGLGSGVSATSAGRDHACAVKDRGVWCWGWNSHGQLGNDSTTQSHVPVSVPGLGSGVSAISAAPERTCALKDDSVWCWGANSYDQFHTPTGSDVPAAVSGLGSGVSAISIGYDHTCALKDDSVWCWGANSQGQLGNGSTTDSPVPVAVQFPPASAGDIAAAPGGQPSPPPPSAGDIAAAPGGQPSPTPPSGGDIAAAPGAQPLPSQPSTDSADHRTAYTLAVAAAAAALAIVAAGMWAVRWRRSRQST